jgi:type III pantothenate kinase
MANAPRRTDHPPITDPATWQAPDYVGLLVVDIGNTNHTLGLWQAGHWVMHWRARTVADKMPDEYAVLMRSFLHGASLRRRAVTAIAIASVVPALTGTWVELARRYYGLEPLVITHRTDLGIRVAIDQPEQAGADRIVNAAAAYALYGGAAIVIDFGTATNFDMVTSDGAYRGGAIAPGIGISHDALVGRAARLHKVDLQPPPSPIGSNTIHAMQSGLFWGHVAMIEGMVARLKEAMRAQFGEEAVRVIGTGGLSALFEQHTAAIDLTAPELTLDGMRLIWERAQQQAG